MTQGAIAVTIREVAPDGGHLRRCEHWAPTYSRDVVQSRWPLPNVWLGVSVEDQAAADARIPGLLDTRRRCGSPVVRAAVGELSIFASPLASEDHRRAVGPHPAGMDS